MTIVNNILHKSHTKFQEFDINIHTKLENSPIYTITSLLLNQSNVENLIYFTI